MYFLRGPLKSPEKPEDLQTPLCAMQVYEQD